MNIFALDTTPETCAVYHNDRHVIKMILEYSQLLSTAHRVLDGENNVLPDQRNNILYKAAFKNHPCAIWVREASANYAWLHNLLVCTAREYAYRYHRTHACVEKGIVDALRYLPTNIPPSPEMTKMRLAMPDEYKSDDPIESYRRYYLGAKRHLAKWKYREVPPWWS